ncbi:hypothetical protein SAMIE_1008920 [Sphingobium amiense]|uniref:Ribbon-helix-helix protein CopG domain-containing protein n=1 Tax=Sphingobium amiense TaxID=135719 RepID=A0A494VZR8_9SPHN|nr:ribbon-helix-helix domain-containing protein [Sphingobium amiense]BBD97391.1 hypothetical protein SAMIE_1008920 [Sphingobium amiense]
MKSYKTRHQLFLPKEMNRRLEHLATSSGRARSEVLVEALHAWFNLRQAKNDEAIGIRLTRIKRNTDWMRRNQGPLRRCWHRWSCTNSSPVPWNPVKKVAQAAGAKLFAQLIDETDDGFGGNAAPATDDPTTRKPRSLQ